MKENSENLSPGDKLEKEMLKNVLQMDGKRQFSEVVFEPSGMKKEHNQVNVIDY